MYTSAQTCQEFIVQGSWQCLGVLGQLRQFCEVRVDEPPGRNLSDELPNMSRAMCFIFKGAVGFNPFSIFFLFQVRKPRGGEFYWPFEPKSR